MSVPSYLPKFPMYRADILQACSAVRVDGSYIKRGVVILCQTFTYVLGQEIVSIIATDITKT